MVRSDRHDSGILERRAGPDRTNVLAITALWIALIAVTNPIGDFPLNDDWAYGWTVKTIVETGRFQLSDWTATNLVPQALWGALFSLPFGFSFTALRLSTLVLGLVGVLATYGVLREARAGPAISLMGALVVALNPLYFGLSHSFNNDVPSFALALSSLYFLLRGLNDDAAVDLGVGIAVGLISTMNRQSGIVVLPAFGLALLIKRGLGLRTGVLAVVPTAVGLACNALYARWLEGQGHKPVLFGLQIKELFKTFSVGTAHVVSTYVANVAVMAVYLGVFLSPFLILAFGGLAKDRSMRHRKVALGVVLAGAAAGVAFAAQGRQMPFAGNVLARFGLGPQVLDGYNAFLGSEANALIDGVWKVLTIIGVAGAAMLFWYGAAAVATILGTIRSPGSDRAWRLVLVGGVAFLYVAAIAGLDRGHWFDRYLIFLLPLSMAVAAIVHDGEIQHRPKSVLAAVALTALALAGSFTVAATHDYLSWNRARWRALTDLMHESRLSPAQIDGGFEFNGWFLGQRLGVCAPERATSTSKAAVGWDDFTCLWATGRGEAPYTIGFVPRRGYTVAGERSFRRWLPWRREALYVLRKVP